MLNRTRAALAIAAVAGLAASASAHEPFLSELFVNAPGTDQGLESIEISGHAGTSLDGFWLLVIEGDGSVAGTLDQKIDLSGLVIGSNGILILRDAAGDLVPAPCDGTSRRNADFAPDIENGSNTFVLGFGTVDAIVGTDLDTDNDGTLDAPIAGFTAVDSVSYVDGDTGGFEYADDFGGTALGDLGTFTPDAIYRLLDCDGEALAWAGGDVLGDNPGPYSWDPAETFGFVENGGDPLTDTTNIGCENRRVCDPGCPADFNGDGVVDSDDFFDFLNAFNVSDPSADFNGDGLVDSDDFFDFLNAFNTGC